MRFGLMAIVLLFAAAVACSGDNDRAPTPTLFPQLEASPGPTSVPPELPTPCTEASGVIVPCERQEMPGSMAWLVDARDGSVIQVFEGVEDVIRYAGFDGDEAVLGIRDAAASEYRLEVHRYNLDGGEEGVEPWAQIPRDATASEYRWLQTWYPGDPLCSRAEGGIEVEGRFYAGAECGPLSPDGTWMIYRVDAGKLEVSPFGELPAWDEWLVNLESGERHELQTGLGQCNADSIFGPTWSPSSRYVFFGDCADGGHIFLGDVEDGSARVIVDDIPSFRNMPDWAGDTEAIIYPDGNGGAVLEYLDEGTAFDPGVVWPARFGAAGRVLYGATPESDEAMPETLIFDIETGESETFPGEALYRRWPIELVSVAGTPTGLIAVLPGPLYCQGLQIYVDGTPLVCIDAGAAPSFSPDGRYVALAQRTGDFEGDGIYDLVVVEVATGRQQVVIRDVRSEIPYPRPAAWNEASTHIIVGSPYQYGPYGP